MLDLLKLVIKRASRFVYQGVLSLVLPVAPLLFSSVFEVDLQKEIPIVEADY